MSDFEPGTRFRPVLDDRKPKDTSSVKRVVLLSGKIYYDLVKERAARMLDEKVAFIRIEELCPFPFQALVDVLQNYSHAADICWLQEEPRNQGAYMHVWPRISGVLERTGKSAKAPALRYIGRKEDAVPAVGVGKTYKAQQSAVINAAFEGL